MRGAVAETEALEKAKAAEVRAKKPNLLRDVMWSCQSCERDAEGNYKKFLHVAQSAEE